jgi:hypothetical protein
MATGEPSVVSFPPHPLLRSGGKKLLRGALGFTTRSTYGGVSFSSRLFKVRAPRNFRNRIFKGKTKHASITTQTNLALVMPLQVGVVGSLGGILPA